MYVDGHGSLRESVIYVACVYVERVWGARVTTMLVWEMDEVW